jgi:Flp pilus assembly protein CpaB
MKSRGLVVVIALVLAVVAAGAMFLFANGVKNNAVGSGVATNVVVSTKDIPTNTNLNTLISQGAFKTIRVPTNAVVEGAVTNVSQLQNQTTTQPIFKNEQIPVSRLSSGSAAKGGALGIDQGHLAVSIKMDSSNAVNSAITRGSYVTVYATFSSLRVFHGATQAQIVNGAVNATSTQATTTLPPLTLTLIPAVKVLNVVNPGTDANGNPLSGTTTITLDLTPIDAQTLVYAQEEGVIWLGLLPPGDTTGHPQAATIIPINQLKGKKAA